MKLTIGLAVSSILAANASAADLLSTCKASVEKDTDFKQVCALAETHIQEEPDTTLAEIEMAGTVLPKGPNLG